MKTSNIILTCLAGSVTLIVTTAFLQLRFTGLKKAEYADKISAKINLPTFKFLLIRESMNLSIVPSYSTSLLIENGKDQEKPLVNYHVQGDTLFIDQAKSVKEDRTLSITLQTAPGNLEWIKAVESAVKLQGYDTPTLTIDLDNSRLSLYSTDSVYIKNLQINGTNHSWVNAYSIYVDSLDLNIDASEVLFHSTVDHLSGSMVNHSKVFAGDAMNINFTKDESSRWRGFL